MIVILNNNNKPLGYMSISNKDRELEYVNSNENTVITDFIFLEDLDLYEYDEVNNTFNLVNNYQEIKARRILEAEAFAEVQRLASLPTLEELKAKKIIELKNKIDAEYKQYLSKYPDVEVESFKDKAREALLVIADNTVALNQTPYLSVLTGNSTIEARNALAFAVNNKILESAQLESFAVQTREVIMNATTIEELEAISN